MKNNKPNLVHIGLPKTGSTALQHHWLKSEQISCCWQNLSPMVVEIRKALLQFKDYDELPEFPIPEFDQPKEDSICNVYTSEAFSTALWGHRLDAVQVTKARWFFADAIYNKVPEAKVLMLVREPKAWVLSMYKQHIQEGGCQTLRGFLLSENAFLMATLNLRELFEIWAEYYGAENIIILPYESLRTETGVLNQILCERLGLTSEANLIGELPQANESISNNEVEFMRMAASWLSHIVKHADRSELTFKNLSNNLLLSLRNELQSQGSLSEFVNRTVKAGAMEVIFCQQMQEYLEEVYFNFLAEYSGDIT